jgi:hypothetical protein
MSFESQPHRDRRARASVRLWAVHGASQGRLAPVWPQGESAGRQSKLRIGVVSTAEGLRRYSKCVARLAKPIAPALADNPNHTLFPGFQAMFGVEWPAQPATWLEIDADRACKRGPHRDRHQAIHKAVSLYSDAIANHLRDGSESAIDLWMAVVPEEVHKYCRPQSKVEASQKQRSGVLMDKAAATRLLKSPGLFEEDNASAEIYLYELDFHNQLKARLLEHKAAVQVVRETTLAPEEFIRDNGMPGRGLQDPATLAWNLATTCFFQGWRQALAACAIRDPASAMSASFSRRTFHRPSRAMLAAVLRCSSTPATVWCFAAQSDLGSRRRRTIFTSPRRRLKP